MATSEVLAYLYPREEIFKGDTSHIVSTEKIALQDPTRHEIIVFQGSSNLEMAVVKYIPGDCTFPDLYDIDCNTPASEYVISCLTYDSLSGPEVDIATKIARDKLRERITKVAIPVVQYGLEHSGKRLQFCKKELKEEVWPYGILTMFTKHRLNPFTRRKHISCITDKITELGEYIENQKRQLRFYKELINRKNVPVLFVRPKEAADYWNSIEPALKEKGIGSGLVEIDSKLKEIYDKCIRKETQ